MSPKDLADNLRIAGFGDDAEFIDRKVVHGYRADAEQDVSSFGIKAGKVVELQAPRRARLAGLRVHDFNRRRS